MGVRADGRLVSRSRSRRPPEEEEINALDTAGARAPGGRSIKWCAPTIDSGGCWPAPRDDNQPSARARLTTRVAMDHLRPPRFRRLRRPREDDAAKVLGGRAWSQVNLCDDKWPIGGDAGIQMTRLLDSTSNEAAAAAAAEEEVAAGGRDEGAASSSSLGRSRSCPRSRCLREARAITHSRRAARSGRPRAERRLG